MTNNNLRVLFIAKNVPVPGMYSSRVIIELAHQLSGFSDVNFLYPKERVPFGFQLLEKYKPIYGLKSWNCEGYDIDIYPYTRIPAKNYSFSLWNSLSDQGIRFYNKNGPFDLIHAHYLMPDGYLARLYAKRYNTPYIVTFRNADVKFLKKLDLTAPDTEKAFLVVRDAAKILTLNKAIKDFVDGLFGVDSIILPHGIRDEVFAAHKKPISEKVTISVVAKAIQRKNIDWVIHAVKNYQGPQDVMLNIVGDGPLSDELKELASDDMRIQFLGKLGFEDVLQTLKESDIFALPSTDETFGMVYPEAAANHNAIIGLQHEGVWGIFEDGKEMLFSKDEADFQKMLHQLIDNKKLRNMLTENAFAKAKKLTWAVIAREYKEMYENIISIAKWRQHF